MKTCVFCFLVLLCLIFSPTAKAQDSLTITITPPLFQLSIEPGDFWSSEIKVVNSNSYDLNMYASIMDFEAIGEEGHGKFIPVINEQENLNTLGGWIDITKEPIFVRAGASKKVSFSIRVPQDAEPGGHYAAILVGNKPPSSLNEGSVVSVSSFVSSLIFLRVSGDVVEEGRIREFSSEKTLYKNPQADFTLRFENTGNVHLRPRGNIVIYNMWGKERGNVSVNHNGNFGNVLPKSTRKFEFSWTGDGNVFEIGRYTAIATLTYGGSGKKNVSSKTYFWVVPIVPVAGVFGGFLLFVVLLVWFIKRYIRRSLMLEKERLGFISEEPKPSIQVLARPIKQGVVDWGSSLTLFQFLKKYFLFLLFITVFLMGIIGLFIYFDQVLLSERDFEVEIKSESFPQQD